jgi:hypothetical protein
MFEDLTPDKGEQGLIRAERIFLILAILTGIIFLVDVLRFVSGSPIAPVTLVELVVSCILSFVTARGIEAQRPWSKWLGYVQGVLFLFNFPVGTAIGIAILIYIYRASKAGMFVRPIAALPPASNPV